MTKPRAFLFMGAAALLAACAETTGPPLGGPPELSRAQLHQLKWQPEIGIPRFAVAGPTILRAAGSQATSGPYVLDNYQASFWAGAGKNQYVEVHYQAADLTWQPYVALSVPAAAPQQWPDGRPFAVTDSVLITLTLDPTSLSMHFEPTGLVFNPSVPAQLRFWYTGANPDFDANGRVDSTDTYIEQNRLGVWVRDLAVNPWTSVASVHVLTAKLFAADLQHFSDYAISW